MTARVRRRRKRTLIAIGTTLLLAAAAVAVLFVGTMTLLDSEQGEAVEIDERQVITFPDTPNALLAVSNDNGQLTSLVVATLDPEGAGGSIVTVPVNADANAGFEAEAAPLRASFDPDDIESLEAAVEGMLAITIERAAVVSDDELAALVEPLTPVEVDLPETVRDSTSEERPTVVFGGQRTLRADLVGDVLTAHDRSGDLYDHHDIDVEVWSRLAESAPSLPSRDDPEVPPETTAELFEDLWRGDVSVRDLAITTAVIDFDEPAKKGPKADAVVVDRRDSLLVFAQVSPNLVSKPNQALSFRVVTRFNDEQLEASDGLFDSNSELARKFIGELLYFQANVVSADTSPAVEGAQEVTLVEVDDPRFLDDLEVLADAVFGEAEVVPAARSIEGVDVVVTLGQSYIDRQMEIEAAAEQGAGSTFDDADETYETDDADRPDGVPAGTDGADEEDRSRSTDDADGGFTSRADASTGDTVETDE